MNGSVVNLMGRPNPFTLSVLFALFTLIIGSFFTGCTTGPLHVHEVYYYKASNGDQANYFRLTVDAKTRLGDAEYRSGWFPKRSVDSLFGEVTTEGGNRANEMREALVELINTNVFKTTRLWLDAAMTNAPPEELNRLNQARRNVLSYPVLRPADDMVLIEYNPIAGIVKEHSDEKFVILLSSNPDEIVGKIAAFTEQEKTAATVEKLSEALVKQRSEDIIARAAVEVERNKLNALIYEALKSASTDIDPDTSKTDDALERIQRLLSTLEVTRP